MKRKPSLSLRFQSHRNIAFVISLALAAGFSISDANARITRIDITSTQSPTFEGKSFGAVGTYEKLRGKAYGEVDPNDSLNADIVDIELAPRNANGNVEYSMDIYILKPTNLAAGNHKLFMEVNNRGGKLYGPFNDSGGGNNPTTAADAGEGFLMNQGYSLAWNGWDISAAPVNDNLTITVPIAKNLDGSTITGPSYEYIVFDNATTASYPLSYPSASLDKAQATLTVKEHLNDSPTVIPASGWEYVDEKTIRLLPAGTPFQQSAIYEFTYTAKDPLVAGLGFAATRDFVSFLKSATTDDFGHPNPLAGNAQVALAFAISQPARYLNDFRTLGFNQGESGQRVFDGIENWIGAGTGVAINYRFAQPARTERNRQNHLYPEGIFPFAFPTLSDSISGGTAGRNESCNQTNTCAKSFEINSASEYWVKTASLLHTDTAGNDLPDPDNVRFFLLSGLEHTVSGGAAGSRGVCQQFVNPNDPNPALRALFVSLDQWVTQGIAPPKSDVPRRSNGTAVLATPNASSVVGTVAQAALGWPNIPGVTYTGLITTRHLFNFGPRFDQGIMDVNPPEYLGRPTYPAFVSKVDVDGNEVAGVRLPPVLAPTGTTSGWALRRAGFGENDGCEASGQYIPFKTTKAERLAANDPRLSLQERYQTHDGYVKAVSNAAQKLQKQRLLLSNDVQKYITAAQNSNVLK